MTFFQHVYALVQCIPCGRVATYGQIARALGQPHAARTVGWAMRAIPEGSKVPWHRVVGASGRISIPDVRGVLEQRRLLEAEGIVFDTDDRIDLNRFGWDGLPDHQVRAVLASKVRDDK